MDCALGPMSMDYSTMPAMVYPSAQPVVVISGERIARSALHTYHLVQGDYGGGGFDTAPDFITTARRSP